MDQVGSSKMDLDSDIDLESGGATSEKDARKGQALSDENSNISSKFMSSSDSSYGSTDAGDRSPYETLASNFDEIYYKNKDMQFMKLGEGIENYVDKKKVKKHSAARPPRPHRPPKGPSLGPYDLKLVKEISELNSKRRKMGRIRAFNKLKRQKPSSMKSNLLAFFVTIIFFLVIIFQGLLGTRV